jgi:REP element-mobilizing transposase RayT
LDFWVMETGDVRERPHRLPLASYRSEVAVAFTVCVQERVRLFESGKVVELFVATLAGACERQGCLVPIYCFMPDHVHVVTLGRAESSDGWRAIVGFKQRTGYWLARNRPSVRWQRNFFDHLLRTQEDLAAHVRYVAENPVRKQLVADWQEYPYTGSIGFDLDAILQSVATVR